MPVHMADGIALQALGMFYYIDGLNELTLLASVALLSPECIDFAPLRGSVAFL